MTFKGILTNITGFSTGFTVSNPAQSDLLLGFKTHLLTAMPGVSQSVIDDIARAIAGLVITIVANRLGGWIDARKKAKNARKKAAETTPAERETYNINPENYDSGRPGKEG